MKLVGVFRLLGVASAAILAARSGMATDYTWNGTTGDWNDSARWVPNGVPGTEDKATITSGTVAVSVPVTVGELAFSGGTITGESTLTIGVELLWNGASTMTGAGTTAIASTAMAVVTGTGDRNLGYLYGTGRTLINYGTFEHDGTCRVVFYSGSVLENRPDALVDLRSNAVWVSAGGATSSILNEGTIRKSAENGDSVFQSPRPTNAAGGVVEAQIGVIRFPSGVNGGGSFRASPGAEIRLESSSTLDDVLFAGGGTVKLIGGTITLSGICEAAHVLIAGSTLAGTHTLVGNWTWENGSIGGPGTTTLGDPSLLRITGTADHDLGALYGSGRSIVCEGKIEHSGSGRVVLYSGSVVETTAAGIIDIQNDVVWVDGGGAACSVLNAGMLKKTLGAGTFNLQNVDTTNTGQVSLQSGAMAISGGTYSNNGLTSLASGTMSLNAGGSSSGQWAASAGTTVSFTGGSPVFAAGSTFGGEGLYRVAGAAVSVAGDLAIPHLELAGGGIGGAAILTVSESFAWSASSSMRGEGTTVIGALATATLSGTGDRDLGNLYGTGRTLINKGRINHSGTCRLVLYSGSALENQADALIDLQSDAVWVYGGGGASTVTNHGTISKSGGTGNSNLQSPKPTNGPSGIMEAKLGTIRLQSGVDGGGTFHADLGASIRFESSCLLSDPVFSGDGSLLFTGGTMTLAGTCSASRVEFAGANLAGTHTMEGEWVWTSGGWPGPGTTTIAAESLLRIAGPGDHDLGALYGNGRTIRNLGIIASELSGRLVGYSSSRIENEPGAEILLWTDVIWVYGGGGSKFTLSNSGTVRKVAADGTSTFQNMIVENNGSWEIASGAMNCPGTDFHNDGMVDVGSGNLTLSGGGSSNGTWNANEAGQVSWVGGGPALGLGSVFTGTGLYRVAGASMSVTDEVSIPRFELASGTVTGNGILTLTDEFLWSGSSSMTGGGTTVIANTATATLSGGGDRDLGYLYGTGRALINQGTLNHSGTCRIVLYSGSSLENQEGALIDLQSDSVWVYGGGGASTVTNHGTIRKSAGTGTSSLQSPAPTNGPTGVIEARSGTIRFNSGVNGGGTFHSMAGAEIRYDTSCTLTDPVFSGGGLQRFLGGKLTLSGFCRAQNTQLAGATLAGSQTLHGQWEWLSGGWPGSGTTTIDEGSRLLISGTGDHDLGALYGSGRNLINLGLVVHGGSGRLVFYSGSVFDNRAGAMVDLRSNANWVYGGGGTCSVINEGTFINSAESGTTTISLPLVDRIGNVIAASGWTVEAAAWVWHAQHGWVHYRPFNDDGYLLYHAHPHHWSWVPISAPAWLWWPDAPMTWSYSVPVTLSPQRWFYAPELEDWVHEYALWR